MKSQTAFSRIISNKRTGQAPISFAGGQVRLCENGGCGFNHQMSLGTVPFETSLQDLP